MGKEAEKLFIGDLTNPGGMVMKRYLQASAKNRKGEESILDVKRGMTVLETEIAQTSTLCSDVLQQTNIVAKIAENFPLIDAAGPGRKLYQVTVSTSHSLNPTTMKEICLNLGYIGSDGEVIPENETKTLEFYWVIPEGIAGTWIKKAPRTYRESKGQSKRDNQLLKTLLKRHIKQYVLPMTDEGPVTYPEIDEERE